jgi:hypothetical protein
MAARAMSHESDRSIADVTVRPAAPAQPFELVGIYTGGHRIGLLARDQGISDQFVSLNALAHRVTGLPLNTNWAVVDRHIEQKLRNCFGS